MGEKWKGGPESAEVGVGEGAVVAGLGIPEHHHQSRQAQTHRHHPHQRLRRSHPLVPFSILSSILAAALLRHRTVGTLSPVPSPTLNKVVR